MSLAMALTAAAAASMVAVSPAVSPPCPAVMVHATFAPAAQARDHKAVTYDTKLVPVSAKVVVVEFLGKPRHYEHEDGHEYEHGHDHGHQHMGDAARSTPTQSPSPQGTQSPQGKGQGTFVGVWVRGVKAHHTFGVHVHTKPCGTMPDDSGPHYQNTKDPKQPSVNPKYANPRNEVWLDLTTNGHGEGYAKAHVDWRFRDSEARSVVIHEHATATGKGHAGMAGTRVACVKVPFKG
ncbi:superoxide dismutase family protein [Streptomyces sparsogenes]|uniref:superoxide dismutase family protein n=1 Tax=Streptomyces sparsogenes TaxID=67365 RepID=UPI001FE16CF8|nr:superoxide dismutase family protein [Streptomyces sparsogenes]